jgi:hypothetical protein
VPTITLRYFDCRGRAEPIRHLLRDRKVPFEDAREPIDDIRRAIAALNAEPSVAAPYGLLPVLDWDGFRVAQTLPIASFVSRELGLTSGVDSRALARLESIASAAYSELTAELPAVVWSPVWFKDLSFEQLLKRIARTPCSYPRKLDALLGASDAWFGGSEAVAADFFAFEGLSAWCAILGEPYLAAIRTLPRLSSWWERVSQRVGGQSFEKSQFTASPFEAELFARSRDFVKTQGVPWPL